MAASTRENVGVETTDRFLLHVDVAQARVDATRPLSRAPEIWHDREVSPSFPFLVDNVPGFIGTMTASGEVEFFNRPVLEYFGKTLDELRDSTFRNEVHSDDLPGVLLAWKRSISTGEPYEIEHRLRRFDGAYRWFHARALPERREDGGIARWYLLLTDIEDLKRSEELARQSHLTIRSIIDSIPGYVHTMRADGSVEFVNQRILDFFQKTAEELSDWAPLIHPEDREVVVSQWYVSIAAGQPYDQVHRVRRADGEWRWFHSRGLPLRDANGQIVRWCNLLVDIDERKKAEEALRLNERNLGLIVDSIPGLVARMSAVGEVELANRQLLAYFGKELEDIRNWTTSGVVHPDDLSRAIETAGKSFASGDPYEMEIRVRRFDGVYRWFQARGIPLRDAEGRIVNWYALHTDIEDRKRAEEALQSSQRELGEIIESMPGLVWCASRDGELAYLNRRILDYVGVRNDDFKSGGWANFLHPDDVASVVASWSHSVASGEPFEVQARLQGSDGIYRWFHSLSQLGRDTDGTPTRWYGLLIDIDERKRIGDTLKSTREQLSRAAQVATLGELSASIAHEVNQPLAAVVANGHACLRWLAAQPPNLMKAQEAAERVVRDGREAGDVVKRIRALFRRTEDQRVELDLNGVILEVVGLIRSETVRKQISVGLELHEGLPPVLGDRVQFQQLILNILINGIEAMSSVEDRPKSIVVRSKPEDSEEVLVEIVDSGVGFNQADRIFDAFFSTKETGMGMGLAICRSIVENHRGQIWAANAPGGGAMFCFRLPSTRSGS